MPTAAPPRPRTSRGAPDAACSLAIDLARAAAVELGQDTVGEHLGVRAEGERVVTHLFATTDRAYVGWQWAVTVARASRAKLITVDEVALLPGPGALVAPEWLPWSERVRPGDLGVGDLLPVAPDDDRLVPAYADVDDEQADSVAFELGMGRPRVLSQIGRVEAAERWYDGPAGPDTPIARAAPGRCGTCGFLVHLLGGLRSVFGACANEWAPDDGRIVALDHGCGAHSETVLVLPSTDVAPATVDDEDLDWELRRTPTADAPQLDAATAPSAAPSRGSVDDAEPGEELGHS